MLSEVDAHAASLAGDPRIFLLHDYDVLVQRVSSRVGVKAQPVTDFLAAHRHRDQFQQGLINSLRRHAPRLIRCRARELDSFHLLVRCIVDDDLKAG